MIEYEEVMKCYCERCYKTWQSKKKRGEAPPKRCTFCKSPYWNKKRKKATQKL